MSQPHNQLAPNASFDRRTFVRGTGLALATAAFQPVAAMALQAAEGHTLPKLSYGYDALEPHIDARTMEIHHSKHHQAYINNLNTALKGHADLAALSPVDLIKKLDSVPESIRTVVRNNGGGHVNHTMFWQMMGPKKGGEPHGKLAKAISTKFGSFAKFQEEFTKAATTRFGSGWAWLIQGEKGLEVISTANQDCPIMTGQTPILCLDVWEHAYYLHYQNRRPDYVKAWWNVVNWDAASANFEKAG